MPEKNENSDLKDIKMLMILQLLQQGVKQSQIAAALNVSEATISRMIPKAAKPALGKK